jgi:cobalt/nickel transport system permease protein
VHVPDGFLAPQITLPAWAVAAPLWAWAARRRFGPASVEALPVVGSLTAVAFALQTIAIPVPGGTSTHLVGATLLALLRGPLVAFVCQSLVLLVQALFFGAGGITVLAVNALALGLAGPAAGWLVHRALRGAGGRVAAFAAAWVAMQVSTAAIAFALGLQHALSPEHFAVPLRPTLLAMLAPSLTLAGALEGAYTAAALSLLRKAELRRAL